MWLEAYFLFCAMWSVGAIVDYQSRLQFDRWLRTEIGQPPEEKEKAKAPARKGDDGKHKFLAQACGPGEGGQRGKGGRQGRAAIYISVSGIPLRCSLSGVQSKMVWYFIRDRWFQNSNVYPTNVNPPPKD